MPTDRFGITNRYFDVRGKEHPPPPETHAALRRAMGVPDAQAEAPGEDPPDGTQPDAVRVLQPGDDRTLRAPVELQLEDGSGRTADRELPADLPLGYHRMRARDGRESLLIVAPEACPLPADLRTWGWAAQV